MKDLLEEVLTKARRYMGMASVCVYWWPYDKGWIARADWSDDPPMKVMSEAHSEPEHALYELSILLDAKSANEQPYFTHYRRLQEVAAELLRRKMEDISEECYCAGWMIGLEFALWQIAQAGGRSYGQGTITKQEAGELLQLADDAKGWHEWHKESDNTTLTPLEEWEAKYAEWLRTSAAKEVSP